MSLVERLEQRLQQTLQEITRSPVTSAFELIDKCDGLLAEETALVARAVERRRNEFAAGRRCARRALMSLGCQPQPILMGRWHEPIWPRAFSGSISHDGRFAAAVVYPSSSGRVWLSIDLIDRPDLEIYRNIADTITHQADAPLPATDPLAIVRLFSAKEAAIKILSQPVGDFIDFRCLRALPTDEGFHVEAPGVDLAVTVRTFDVDDVLISLGSATSL
jgi:4'-phosphopantetheinyl transferase EntD